MSDSRSSPQNKDGAAARGVVYPYNGSVGDRQEFDTTAALAADMSGCAFACICLVGDSGEILLGSAGEGEDATKFMPGLFEHLVEQDEPVLLVPDANADRRFAELQKLFGGEGPGFLAGAAIEIDGQDIGGIFVMDPQPREQPDPKLAMQLQRLAGLTATLLDLSVDARRRNEADLARKKSEFRHSLALHAASIASWMWHIKTNRVATDQTLRDWVDLDLSSDLSMQDLLTIVHPDDIENVRVALDMSLVENVDFHCEFRTRSNGKWLMGQGRVYERDRDGRPASMAGIFLDISKTKQAEATTRLLLRELDHRVKNTLAVLQSLAAQTLKSAQTPEQFMRAFSGRLQALAATHTLLSEHPLHRVPVQSLLQTLIGPYAERFAEQVTIEGDNVPVGPDEALGLGLVIHELATNAVRHGALSVREGRLAIHTKAARSNTGPALTIHWRELGGPEISETPPQGLGSVLINRGLQKILGSQVETRLSPPGVEARISFPLPRETKY